MTILLSRGDLGTSNISTLIRKLNYIFKIKGKNKEGYVINIQSDNLDIVSALIIYKFFDYSVKNDCMVGPEANIDEILDMVQPYGLQKLFKELINEKIVDKLYAKLKPMTYKDFFIAPHAINRKNFKSKEELENKYTDVIENYYKDKCPDLIQYIKTCICEISSNFLYHAKEDENSILIAKGDHNKIEIVCVDNSIGIISNLMKEGESPKKVIKRAFERGETSKKAEGHCGTGLWFIRKICENLNGILRVYTEGMSYICKGGRVFVHKTPYWHGSVVYLKLNIQSSNNIEDFFTNFIESNDLGLINN